MLVKILTFKKADIEIAAANVLDIAAQIDPSKIVLKIKYHLLTHLREDIIRLGPLLGMATETYEAFNAVFRFCSVLSNHLAPSCDIAMQLAGQESLRHILSGGCWRRDENGDFKHAGPFITNFLSKHTFLQNLLGYGKPDKATIQFPGESNLSFKKKSLRHIHSKAAFISNPSSVSTTSDCPAPPQSLRKPSAQRP